MVNEKSIGGIIFLEENKKRLYLLLEYERINDKEGKHKYWDFPKGHIEKKESEEDTLLREIKEETNLTNLEIIKSFKKSIKYFFIKDNKFINKEVVYYLLKSSSKNVKISFEHSNYKWSEFNEALELIGFKSSRGILKEAEKFINNSLLKYNNI
mgnify:CR=1 FL=1